MSNIKPNMKLKTFKTHHFKLRTCDQCGFCKINGLGNIHRLRPIIRNRSLLWLCGNCRCSFTLY
uniref:Uncharacterized protein n=1 Tax=Babesia bovis TaxID=5865 RepID=S6C9U9_BABBO|nr:hypothetical protein [Babesia bovis]